MRIKKFNEEVFFAGDRIVKVGGKDIVFLEVKARRNPRRRIRLCAHRNVDDTLHEMLIVHERDNYIRPHKHLHKTESFHIIEGLADVVVFDEMGNIAEIIKMGDYASGRCFYCRIFEPYYHTLFVKSRHLVFHEVTNGPFKKSDTVFAPWSADEKDSAAKKKFMRYLEKAVKNFLARKKNE